MIITISSGVIHTETVSLAFGPLTDGTKDKSERCNRWRNNVGKDDKVSNHTITIVSPLIEGYLWIISVVTQRGHGWISGRIFFTTSDGMRNKRWRKWRGQSFFKRTGLENERVGEHTLAVDNGQVFFC